MKGLLGDAQPADGKALELKIGQMVRAVLVKMLDEQEGIIQINGTQVQAKLETPLQPGQSTLLQVQPQSLDGTLVLKQVDQQAAVIPEATMKEWLKGAGLPEQKWTAQLVTDLKREGVPLTRETAAQFKQAQAEMPQGTDAKTWMNAAALASKRGLPMTSATIQGLAQTQSGAPAHVLLEALEQGLAAWSLESAGKSGTAGESAQPPTTAQAAAAKLQALLTEGAALMRSGAVAQPAPAGSAAAGEAAAVSARSADAGASSAAPSARGGGEAATGAAEAKPAPAPAVAPQAAAGATAARSAAAQPASSGAAAAAEQAAPADPAAAAPSSGGTTAAQPAAPQSWVGQLMKWLGVDHERLLAASATDDQLQSTPKLAKQPNEAAQDQQQPRNTNAADAKESARGNSTSAVIERALQQQQQQASQLHSPGQAPTQEGVKHAAAETMKSALMTIASSDEVPGALRDTAQQLVQHITGQQLLLSPEKTGALLSHVTMFIPMKGADGSQTASVHIQTRRGRKGELDADNCRLLFDLRMKALGDTVVDVQVVDKIVSINLWNDHPMTGELIESSRTELTEALQNSGYQLLTLKATPMPERMAARMNGADAASSQKNGQEWSAKPYKGVDFRV
ncbi:flagellar hook-length control protein FliK [Paenibacillus taihuensis]|uniref:Flagellar hook-length control protein FliK n=2 Tax=Paenibacillus taihuensis TaxID=1156355 RepID=A0A3D9SPA1_9BACL|nr:flagellar hook-length control protein FliK [Paenibacillus taihuensis]